MDQLNIFYRADIIVEKIIQFWIEIELSKNVSCLIFYLHLVVVAVLFE